MNDLYGSKAYFTGFDYLIINSRKKKDKYIAEVERSFKILLLTKNHVICPLSHFYTPEMFRFLKRNLSILTEKLIVPAVGSHVRSPEEYLKAYEIGTKHNLPLPLKSEILSFYSEYLKNPVIWNSIGLMGDFKNSLLTALDSPDSILSTNLHHTTALPRAQLIRTIGGKDAVTRYDVNQLIKNWQAADKLILKNYCNLLYHRIGARHFQLECSLPITSYVDYSKDQLLNKKVLLSEQQVFLKLLFERMYSLLTGKLLNVSLLDSISYKSLAEVKVRLNHSDFTTAYNDLIEKTLHAFSIEDPDFEFDYIADPLLLLQKLNDQFEQLANEEIKRIPKIKSAEGLGGKAYSFSLDAVGFSPAGPFLTGAKMLSDIPDIVNLFRFFRSKRELGISDWLNEYNDREIMSYVSKFKIRDKTLYYDALKLIQSVAQKSTAI